MQLKSSEVGYGRVGEVFVTGLGLVTLMLMTSGIVGCGGLFGGNDDDDTPSEGDSCGSVTESFCIAEDSPILWACLGGTFTELHCLHDLCQDDGKTWSGECGYSYDKSHDVCFCENTGSSVSVTAEGGDFDEPTTELVNEGPCNGNEGWHCGTLHPPQRD